MTNIFISYARETRPIIDRVAFGLQKDGHEMWWDEKFRGGDFVGALIEDKISVAASVLVTWSGAARRSIWVHAEAHQALEAGKLVQMCLDESRPPVPFNVLHFIDFSSWNGTRNDKVWKSLRDPLNKRHNHAGEQGGPVNFSKISVTRMAIGGSRTSTLLSLVAPLISAIAVGLFRSGRLTGANFLVVADVALLASLFAVGFAVAQFLRFDVGRPK